MFFFSRRVSHLINSVPKVVTLQVDFWLLSLALSSAVAASVVVDQSVRFRDNYFTLDTLYQTLVSGFFAIACAFFSVFHLRLYYFHSQKLRNCMNSAQNMAPKVRVSTAFLYLAACTVVLCFLVSAATKSICWRLVITLIYFRQPSTLTSRQCRIQTEISLKLTQMARMKR